MKLIQYQAKLTREAEGGYSVSFPDVEGCFSEGDTIEEALENAQEALSLHLEEARNPNWNVPKPRAHKGKGLFWVEPDLDIAIPLTIRLMREQSNLSQTQLARRLDMKVQTYQKLEYPRKSNPGLKTLINLLKVTGFDLEIIKRRAV